MEFVACIQTSGFARCFYMMAEAEWCVLADTNSGLILAGCEFVAFIILWSSYQNAWLGLAQSINEDITARFRASTNPAKFCRRRVKWSLILRLSQSGMNNCVSSGCTSAVVRRLEGTL